VFAYYLLEAAGVGGAASRGETLLGTSSGLSTVLRLSLVETGNGHDVGWHFPLRHASRQGREWRASASRACAPPGSSSPMGDAILDSI
jgi:hypothetical protein